MDVTKQEYALVTVVGGIVWFGCKAIDAVFDSINQPVDPVQDEE